MYISNNKVIKYQDITFHLRMFLMLYVTLIFGDQAVYAAPENRGAMGTVVTLSTGGFMGTGTNGEGERNTSQLGGGFHLMIGEEVIPRLFLGLGIDSYFGSDQEENTSRASQLFSFGFEGRYRITAHQRGLILLAGLGVGVGGVINEGESITDAEESAGGSIWKVGLGYELGSENPTSSVVFIPSLIFQRLGPQMDNKVSLNIISLNMEVLYTAGR
jgi:hypothetical protein